MKKDLLLLVLTALIAVSPLIGSGQQEDPGGERMEISIGFFKSDINYFDDPEDKVLQHIEEKFNVDFVLMPVTWGNFTEKYTLWAASGELPDYFAHAITSLPQYNDWVEQGIVKALPADLSRYPNIADIVDSPKYEGFKRDGLSYMIPRSNDTSKGEGGAAQYAMLVRKDWMENLGIDAPESHAEFLDMLKAFTYNDPDGDGKNNTLGVIPRETNWGMETIFFPFNPMSVAGGYWEKNNNKWIPSLFSDKNLPGYIALNELHKAGVVDVDYVSMQSTQEPVDRFVQGKVGVLLTQALPNAVEIINNTWQKFNPGSDMFESVTFLDTYPWASPDGKRYHFNQVGFWSENYFSSSVSDEKQKKILEIADYLLSDEGKDYWLYGIEGETYKREGDKIIDLREIIEGTPVAVERIYPSTSYFSRMVSWGMETLDWDHPLLRDRYGDKIMDLCNGYMSNLLANTEPMVVNYGVDYIMTPMRGKITPPSMAMISFSDDPVAAWEKELRKAESAGLDEWISEVNVETNKLGY
ncbi:MAG: extracellular solute-binding protein [Peptostreptococcaceae bacterium]|nr:extracellular solute-binding protein [Peptostreptococcaceae bacterium]